MHSMSKMAAVRYFSSIHNNTAENKNIWTPFNPKPKLPSSLAIYSTDCFYKDCKYGSGQHSSTTLQDDAKAAMVATLGCLAEPDYQPLKVFCVKAEDRGPATWSEAEEICERSIRLKEIELCNMMGDKPSILPYKQGHLYSWMGSKDIIFKMA